MNKNTKRLDIFYNGQKANGKTLNKNQTQIKPQVLFDGKEDVLFTLLVWDPDAPAKSWLHWLITNIPGSTPDINQGDEIISYAPPTPPSGTHRYFFTLYEHPTSIMVRAPEERGNFNVEAFQEQYGLKKVLEKIVRVPAK